MHFGSVVLVSVCVCMNDGMCVCSVPCLTLKFSIVKFLEFHMFAVVFLLFCCFCSLTLCVSVCVVSYHKHHCCVSLCNIIN